MDAIISIRQESAISLRGTLFRALPLNEYKDKKVVDHLRILKARPDEAITYMHRSEELFHAFL